MSEVTINLFVQVKLYDLGEDLDPVDPVREDFENKLNEAFEEKWRFYFAYKKPGEPDAGRVRRVIPTSIESDENGVVRFRGYDLDRSDYRQFLASRVVLSEDEPTAVSGKRYGSDPILG